jgi:hypothetical protein
MIDKWFKNDLDEIFGQHKVAVFIDESGDSQFLIHTVEADYKIQTANTEIDELHVKYQIEKSGDSPQNVLIYTTTPKDELKFIREYCETCGCLEIRYLQNYVKDKVHQTMNLNINLPKEELISAAKVSVGKDRTYWLDLSHKGASEIFDLKKELLPFVDDPETYSKKKYDAQLRETFYRKVNELLKQDYIAKPVKTLAEEVVKAMLDGLAVDDCNKILQSIYTTWLDSVSYQDSFKNYLNNYTLPSDLNVWKVNVNHPFRDVDEKWLSEIGNNIIEKSSVINALAKIRQRNQSTQAQAMGISFWGDVITLLEFDPKNISYLSTFQECVEFYQKHFFKVDSAIRSLYTEFLNKKKILEPFQELYKEYVSVFLDKWFQFWKDYNEGQTGSLQRIINNMDSKKTAVIVGDGVAYEIAELVSMKVKGSVNLTKEIILADIPSETENNMSRIYMENGITEAIQSNRERYLIEQNPGINIDLIRLDEVNEEPLPGQLLICTYKDIDDMGEKLQQKALKYFPETIDFFANKITLLLNSGYSKVYLITDHGFVLTGLLSDADKISVMPEVPGKSKERYYISDTEYSGKDWIVRERNGSYFYFAKSMNSFRSTGALWFCPRWINTSGADNSILLLGKRSISGRRLESVYFQQGRTIKYNRRTVLNQA